MATKVPKIILEDFDDMLAFEQKEPAAPAPVGAAEMEFGRMEPLPGHKFKLYEGQRLDDMVESIRQFGILSPIILWHTDDDKYIILSGHNRVNAGKLAGLTKGPIIIKTNLTREDAVLIASETNLRQRSFADLSHSERAYCLAQHYDAMKSQGKRNDLLNEIETLLNPHDSRVSGTSAEPQRKLESRDKISKDYGLSRDKVAKYIRLANLIPALLEKVDTDEVAFLAAYELSFIEDKDKQQQIAEFMEYDGYKLDVKKSELLRGYYEGKKLNEDTIVQILSGEKTRKPKSDKPKAVKIKPAVITKYFTAGQTPKEIEDTIDKALALYFAESEVDKGVDVG